MEQTNILSGRREASSIVWLCAILAVITIAPLIGNQYITGTIVNAGLLVAAAVFGFGGAFILCLLPSLIALASGTLPAVLAPMVPFIILGNILLVYFFSILRKSNYWMGLLSASLLKFSLLFFASNVIMDLFIKKQVAAKIAVMMSYPQLITALAGGAVAFFIIRRLEGKKSS
jgi:hypothetical protein